MKTVSIINRKGGVGKSTTASTLAAGLAESKKKILLIDMDAQRNLSYGLKVDEPKLTSYNVMARTATVQEAVIEISKYIDLIPATKTLSTADVNITDTGKEYRLKEALKEVEDEYDYCIIDTPPALGILTVNALTASDTCIIPVQAEIYSLQGTGDLYETINTVRKYCNPGLGIAGILVTRCNERMVVTRELLGMIEESAKAMGTKVYKSKIRECTMVKEAQAGQEDLFSYAPKCNAALDYKEFVKEFIKDEKDAKKKEGKA